MTKRSIRRTLRQRRDALLNDALEKQEMDQMICLNLKKVCEARWKDLKGRFVFSYLPFGSEADIRSFLDWWKDMGGRVAYPRVIGDHCMVFQEMGETETFVRHAYGMEEPPETAEIIKPETADLMLIPGLGFDLKGHRLGYGGGFYDSYLPDAQNALWIAIGYESQIVEEIPREAHDQVMDLLVTEKEIYKIQ